MPGSTSLASAQLLRAVRQASGARQTHLTFKDSEFISLMLILQARPHATRVAGYRTWQSLGRYVKKSEKAL